MKKILKNAKIIDYENKKFKNVHILIEGNKIAKILNSSEKIGDFNTKDVIDCSGNLIIPGFINSQSYLIKNFYYTHFKSTNVNDFEENYLNFYNKLTAEEKFYIYKYQLLNAIKNGVTTVCDFDNYNLSLKKAVLETKINFVYKLSLEKSSDKIDENLINKLDLQNENYIFGLNNVLFNSEKNFSQIIKLSRKYNKPVLCNGNENLFIAGEIDNEFSQRNVKLLENLGFLDSNHILNNLNVIDKDDYEILENYNTKLIFSPSLNLNLGYKNANIYSLNKQNLIGISSFNNDYNLELFLAQNLEKDSYDSLEVFSEETLLNFCTKNNARILGIKNIGEIKEGYAANLIILNDANLMSLNAFIKNFDNRLIKSVIINGELNYNNSHFIENKDYNKLQNLCNAIINKYN